LGSLREQPSVREGTSGDRGRRDSEALSEEDTELSDHVSAERAGGGAQSAEKAIESSDDAWGALEAEHRELCRNGSLEESRRGSAGDGWSLPLRNIGDLDRGDDELFETQGQPPRHLEKPN